MYVHVRANVEGLPREAASDTCDLNPRDTIADYMREIADTYDLFKTMAAEAVNRWCFYDLKKRGAIM